jgi:uncharacterized membrane protein YeiB
MPESRARTPGYDVARAVAILGMILVNYRGKLGAYAGDVDWLVWAGNRIEGKSAALFVVLAGIGISLRTRRAREQPGRHLHAEQVALVRRAAILFGVGLLMMPLWDWDILHFYGVFLALAAAWLCARDRTLLLLAVGFVAGQVLMFNAFDWWAEKDLSTSRGATLSLCFNGLHPLFPWMAFLLFGMWLGRRDLGDRRFRRCLLLVALVLVVAAEGLDAAARPGEHGRLIPWEHVEWLRTWPRPARPMFVLAGTSISVVAIVLCIELAEAFAAHPLVVALVATGQLAFTLYVLHAIAIVLPVHLGLFAERTPELATLYALGVFGLGVVASTWWRRRYAHGPLEALLRSAQSSSAISSRIRGAQHASDH